MIAMKRYSIFVFCVLAIKCVIAQNLTGGMIVSKIKEKTTILNDYQNMMADKDKNPDVKRHYMQQALNLFVNQGNPFSVDTIKYSGSSITTKSTFRNKPVRRKVKDYLQGIMDLRYTPIDLTAVKVPALPDQINESDFVKYGDNQYKCTVLVTRELAGYIDGIPVYRDITPYEYTIFFYLNKTIEGTDYVIYLNDLEVEEIKE